MDILRKAVDRVLAWVRTLMEGHITYARLFRESLIYMNTINERARRLDSFVDGMQFDHLGELVGGRWEETEEGVMTRLVTCPMNISPLMRRVTIMETMAKKDVDNQIIHRHSPDGFGSNQVLFVEQGRIEVTFYLDDAKSKDCVVTCRSGEVVKVSAGRYHAVSMWAGTKLLSIYFPPI